MSDDSSKDLAVALEHLATSLGNLAATALELAQARIVQPQPAPPPSPPQPLPEPTAQVYMSGRWHLRDGNAYGRPPYYADLDQRRYLRPAVKR